jgi:hypothetical protein
MRVISLAGIAIVLALTAVAGQPRTTPPALACTGGGYAFEELARGADLIFIGRVVSVGDAINRAPTATATATPIATATPSSPPQATHRSHGSRLPISSRALAQHWRSSASSPERRPGRWIGT